MSIKRWLRASAAVAAAAAFNASAPAAVAAPAPCGPGGTIAQGYVLDQYLLVKHERVLDGTGVKLCFQAGGGALGATDTYGVIDVPLPTVSMGTVRNDNNSDTCVYYGGKYVYDSYTPGVGTFRISYLVRSTDVQLCSEGYDANGVRILSSRTLIPLPQPSVTAPSYGTVTPAPARDTSMLTGYPSGAPSSSCSGPNGRRVLDFWNQADGSNVKISYTAPLLNPAGPTYVCVRRQSVAGQGVGGRLKVDAGSVPTVDVYGDRGQCTRPVHHMNAPAYLHVDETPSGNPKSICVSTSPTSTTRVHFSNGSAGLVGFTPDP